MDGFANTLEGDLPRFADCWWIGFGGEEKKAMKNESQVFGLSSCIEAVVTKMKNTGFRDIKNTPANSYFLVPKRWVLSPLECCDCMGQ